MNDLKWERTGDAWLAIGQEGIKYKIRQLKDGNYSAVILGRKPRPYNGNHLGYYGTLSDAAGVCEGRHKKGATT